MAVSIRNLITRNWTTKESKMIPLEKLVNSITLELK